MKTLFYTLSFLCLVVSSQAQSLRNIQLKQEKVDFQPKGFYIADVVDDRMDKTGIGLYTNYDKKEKITLQNGAAASLKTFIAKNVQQDKNAQAVVLHIDKMDIDTKKEGMAWGINAKIKFSFYIDNRKVIEYTGGGHGQIDTDPASYIEGFIRRTIDQDLTKFDKWWYQNNKNVATSNSVKINVVLGKTFSKPNSIAYNKQKPLRYEDFTGPADAKGFEMAATVSGIGVTYTPQSVNGQLVINVTVTPFFNKGLSWFKPAGKKANVLSHEQTHFDITALYACKLINTLRNTTFTKDNYDALLEQLRIKNQKESIEEEDAYDKETSHGTLSAKQQAWEKKIKEKLKTVGCF
jgi:hypothetical protein